MQAVEGLTRLINMADKIMSFKRTMREESDQALPEDVEEKRRIDEEQDQLAISICQAMLNTALPVARFRLFVKIESGRMNGREFTICAVNIEDVVAALYPLSQMSQQVYVTLWEQRPTGADMLEAYQGKTRSGSVHGLRKYLDGLAKYSVQKLAN